MSSTKIHVTQPLWTEQPWKTIYIVQRCLQFAILIPFWLIYYSIFPRPRSSWTVLETVAVRITRHAQGITANAGFLFAVRDPTKAPKHSQLKETDFYWAKRIPDDMFTGIITENPYVHQLEKVGMILWPKGWKAPPFEDWQIPERASSQLVGLYLHGGAYAHMNATEGAQTSSIPRKLMQDGAFTSIHAVEYRVLSHAPFPGALQDAIAGYIHLVRDLKIPPKRIVVIGDSAGGNLALALTMWVRDTKHLDVPGGLILLSPWTDPSHSFPYHPSRAYQDRGNPDSDILRDTPASRTNLVRRLLGPAKPLHFSRHSETLVETPDKDVFPDELNRNAEHGRSPSHEHHYDRVEHHHVLPHRVVDVEEWELDMVHSPYISPASLRRTANFTGFPKSFVHWGDAERLQDEVERLVKWMEEDGVEVSKMCTHDAPHVVLLMHVWKKDVRDEIWNEILLWTLKKFRRDRLSHEGVASS